MSNSNDIKVRDRQRKTSYTQLTSLPKFWNSRKARFDDNSIQDDSSIVVRWCSWNKTLFVKYRYESKRYVTLFYERILLVYNECYTI